MEIMYFDPETCWFLGSKTHDIPEGAVRLSPARYKALLEDVASTPGGVIVAGKSGKPFVQRPDIASRRVAVKVEIKREARRRIEAAFPLTAQINAMRAGDSDDRRFGMVDDIRQRSNLIEQDLMDCDDPERFPANDHPLWTGE